MGRPSGSRPSAVQTVTKLTSRVLAVPSGCLPRRPSTAPARAPAPCRRSASAPARVSTSTILVDALPHLICYRETVVASQLLLPKEATMSTISPGTRQELVTAVADRYRQSTAAEKRLICSRPRGNAEFWTRVDRKMLWWPGHRQTDRFRVCSPASRRVAALRPRFRGAHGLDAGSAHAVQTCPCLTMPHSRPPRCCGRPSVQIDAVSDDR